MRSKRLFDIGLALMLTIPLLPLLLVSIACLRLREPHSVFYISERMHDLEKPFAMIKLRTMAPPTNGQSNEGVSGGAKSHRISPFGKNLRRFRLDELPQLWNVLRGDMSFVGPRPPLRRYTEMFPALYAEVLATPPGLTGLATVLYYSIETKKLARTQTADEAEAVYIHSCVRQKARLDRFYVTRRSMAFDLYILYLTAASFFPLPGRRARRLRADKR